MQPATPELVWERIYSLIGELKLRGESNPRMQSPGQETLTALQKEMHMCKNELLAPMDGEE